MAGLHAAALDKLNDSDIAMPYLAEAIDVSSVLADQAQASMVAFQITRTMARAMLEFLDSDDAQTIRDEPTMLERDERADGERSSTITMESRRSMKRSGATGWRCGSPACG